MTTATQVYHHQAPANVILHTLIRTLTRASSDRHDKSSVRLVRRLLLTALRVTLVVIYKHLVIHAILLVRPDNLEMIP